MNTKHQTQPNWIYLSLALTTIVVLWLVIVKALAVPSYLFPSPIQVFSVIASDPLYFLRHTAVTALEALAGLILALVCALTGAAILATLPRLRSATMPLIIGLQAVPIVAIAPLVVLWLGSGFASKAVMAAVLCWFPSVMAATRGLIETEENLTALRHLPRLLLGSPDKAAPPQRDQPRDIRHTRLCGSRYDWSYRRRVRRR